VPVATVASISPVLPIEHIWQRSIDPAQEKLREKELPLLEVGDGAIKSVAHMSGTVGDLKRTIDEDLKGGRLRKVLKTIDNYSKTVDISILHNPAITSLIWEGVTVIHSTICPEPTVMGG